MATAPKKDAPPAERAPGKALSILAKREGFRRAGFGFGSEKVVIALSSITEEQEALLRREPMLLVADIDIPGPVESTGTAA